MFTENEIERAKRGAERIAKHALLLSLIVRTNGELHYALRLVDAGNETVLRRAYPDLLQLIHKIQNPESPTQPETIAPLDWDE